MREKPSKARFELNAGEVLTIETPGGGGWGKVYGALTRSVETV